MLLSFGILVPNYSFAVNESELAPLIDTQNVEAIRAYGQPVAPILANIYKHSDLATKPKLAAIFYELSWKSEEAKRALLEDIKTDDQALRLQVQWALGRVSSDDEIVSKLLDNMRTDPNPLFRDKAACALASDQIHLTEKQKIKLYQGVIAALSDDKEDVRRIAGQVMSIQTGQTKGYNATAPLIEREKSVAAWNAWLEEYKKQ